MHFNLHLHLHFSHLTMCIPMKQLTHESLTVYQRAIQFVAWASEFATETKLTGVMSDQFKRAFVSIPLNIAEGCGKHSKKDQARFYDIARGSALECGACLDVLVAMRIAESQEVESGKQLLIEVVAMLTSLSRNIVADRVHEDTSAYEMHQA